MGDETCRVSASDPDHGQVGASPGQARPGLVLALQGNRGTAKEIAMPTISDQRLQEASLLARAVENVFRKLIRFLVGRISLVRLQEMLRHIYVEETELKLQAECPGKNVPLTRLALSTGLDTRALVQIREGVQLGGPRFQQQFLSELTPESAVVEAWASRVRLAPAGSDASVLDFGSEDAGFESLVRATVPMRGLTTQSILQRLVATNSVEQDREQKKLRLLVDHFSPYLSQDEPNILNAAFSAISNLISTLEHNVSCPPEEKLFQRQTWTFRLDPADQADFQQAMRAMLEQFEKEALHKIGPWEQDAFAPGLVTAGAGFYYFEET
jgi:hypothetical protein